MYPGALSNLPGQTRLYSAATHGGSIQKGIPGNSPAVQRLGLGTFTVEGVGSIRGQGTKIPQAKLPNKQAKKECQHIF